MNRFGPGPAASGKPCTAAVFPKEGLGSSVLPERLHWQQLGFQRNMRWPVLLQISWKFRIGSERLWELRKDHQDNRQSRHGSA